MSLNKRKRTVSMEQPARTRVDENGSVSIPPSLLKGFGINKGSFVTAEGIEGGILLKPANDLPIEDYTPERVAEFLLGGAVDKTSYDDAVEEVRKMGLEPSNIDHCKPTGVE
jgi:bifunctional DNA-binding transcriptional regulator/antitoxin component of YhaV-PrlF toxin-antitoxin module